MYKHLLDHITYQLNYALEKIVKAQEVLKDYDLSDASIKYMKSNLSKYYDSIAQQLMTISKYPEGYIDTGVMEKYIIKFEKCVYELSINNYMGILSSGVDATTETYNVNANDLGQITEYVKRSNYLYDIVKNCDYMAAVSLADAIINMFGDQSNDNQDVKDDK